MEYGRNIHHIRYLGCLALDDGSQVDDFIHGHIDLLGSVVILVIKLILHIIQEFPYDRLGRSVDIESIGIREKISREDIVSVIIDLDLGYEIIIDEEIRRVHTLIEFFLIEDDALLTEQVLDLLICGSFRYRNGDARRFLGKEIHELII